MLKSAEKCGIICTTDGWIACPACKQNKRMAKIQPDTEGKNIVYFCRRCKTQYMMDIKQGQCFYSQS